MTSFLRLTIAALLEFSRDRTSLTAIVLLPLLFVGFFGLAYSGSGAAGVGGCNANLRFVVPGILGMGVMWLGVFAAIPLVAQRELGVLKRFRATPLAGWELIGAQVVSRLVVSLFQGVLVLAFAALVFGVPVAGSWLILAVVLLLGTLSFVTLGYAVAALAPTQQAAHGWTQLVSMPMVFLSGVFFPIDVMPAWLRPAIEVLPLTYLVDAIRQVAQNGQTLNVLALDLAVLAGWTALALVVATRGFRWR